MSVEVAITVAISSFREAPLLHNFRRCVDRNTVGARTIVTGIHLSLSAKVTRSTSCGSKYKFTYGGIRTWYSRIHGGGSKSTGSKNKFDIFMEKDLSMVVVANLKLPIEMRLKYPDATEEQLEQLKQNNFATWLSDYAVPRKKGRYVGLARPTGGASSSSSAHYPRVDELMEQIKTKDTEIEFLKKDNAEIRVELQQNRTAMEQNNVLTQTLLQRFRTRFGEDF
ncbi:hypothetical protein F2Q68_00020825 [Brassica cretica]|uniref:Uncharacterized protein n=1 Tax=Brassica cretica TaxID=69181 RepID=A0A8S9FX92_BRACR|nr:hypothetical protein F2Q68_00020825 [Brassica cretica]